MFDSLEGAIKWASAVTGASAGVTIVPDADDGTLTMGTYVLVNRVGGTIEYPHDFPRFGFRVYSESNDVAESMAYQLALTASSPIDPKTPTRYDDHFVSTGTPTLFSYGTTDDGMYYIWECDIDFTVNLLDITEANK